MTGYLHILYPRDLVDILTFHDWISTYFVHSEVSLLFMTGYLHILNPRDLVDILTFHDWISTYFVHSGDIFTLFVNSASVLTLTCVPCLT